MKALGGPAKALLMVATVPALLLAGMHVVYADKVYPGIRSGPLMLGGRSAADAEAVVTDRAAKLTELKFEHDGQVITIPAADVGLKVDAAGTVKAAMAEGRDGTVAALVGPLRAAFGTPDITLHYELNQAAFTEKLLAQAKGLATPVKNAGIIRSGSDFTITKEHPGTVIDLAGNLKAAQVAIERFTGTAKLYLRPQQPEIVTSQLAPAKAQAEQIVAAPLTVTAGSRNFEPVAEAKASWIEFVRQDQEDTSPQRKVSLLGTLDGVLLGGSEGQAVIPSRTATLVPAINEDRVGKYVKGVADSVDSPPVNARLAFVNGQVTVSGAPKNGAVVERAKAVKVLAAAAQSVTPAATLPVVDKPADIRPETLPTLGLKTLVGSSTTTFAGSPPGRTYNIGVGAKQFDGALIKPGQEFSFNDVLGDVGPETGYVEELVILENKTEKQYGGGLCQVSTTMFRAAMGAGLPITARTNHSYAVHYYAPIGMDATIYPPNPDMKFRNNSPGWILVQARQVGESVTFDFYGTNDGRQSSAQVVSSNATEEGGGTASFRYSVTGGPEPIDRMFYSTYKPKSQFPQTGSLN